MTRCRQRCVARSGRAAHRGRFGELPFTAVKIVTRGTPRIFPGRGTAARTERPIPALVDIDPTATANQTIRPTTCDAAVSY